MDFLILKTMKGVAAAVDVATKLRLLTMMEDLKYLLKIELHFEKLESEVTKGDV